MALLRLLVLPVLPVAVGGVLSVHSLKAGGADEDDAVKPHAQAPNLAQKKANAVSALFNALQRGDFAENSAKHMDKIKKLGDQMTQDYWLNSGPEALVGLKGKVVKSSDFKSKVGSKCSSFDEDCSFNKGTLLFCDSLELAASQDRFGDMETLENLMSATAMSTRFYGVDTVTQSALIARWDKEDQWASSDVVMQSRAASASFSGLRQRIIESEDFQALIKDTCTDVAAERPECRSRAKRGLFCQALGQSASVMLGPFEAGKRVAEALKGM